MSGMEFPFGRTVYRLRAGLIPDPYGDDEVRGDWEHPEIIPIPGAFVAQTSTSLLATATRDQAAESKSLFDPITADVEKGDRIFTGEFDPPLPDGENELPEGTVMRGPVYTIDGIPPEPDSVPWTGWTPPREIPLTRYLG